MPGPVERNGMGTVFEQLAELATGLNLSDLPDATLRESKRRLLDALGCMLAGAREPLVRRIYDSVDDGSATATLVGGNRRAPVAGAALANCAALRSLDYMDGHSGPYPCHPAFTIPTILAAAEQAQAAGADVARAIVLGYELDIRLQLGAGDPDITAHGWSGSTNLGLAVPFAIGGLLDLSEEQLAHALAISAVHTPTLDVSGHGQMAESKACVDGMVAMTSVYATLLARRDVKGPVSAFEAPGGFIPILAHEYDKDVILRPMDSFRIQNAYTKRFNAVKCAQSAIAAALTVRNELPGGPRDIERIKLSVAERDYLNQSNDDDARRRPQNRDTANHSAVYCTATALVHGDVRPTEFAPERLSDPTVKRLVDLTVLSSDAALTQHWPAANPATVEIVTSFGTLLSNTVIHPPGHPSNPLTDAQLEDKFRALTSNVLEVDQVDSIVSFVNRLEKLPSITPLMELVGKG